MESFLEPVKKEIESMRCSEHNEYAKATIQNDSIRLSTCCEKFKDDIMSKMDDMITRAVTSSIEDALK